MNSPITGKPMVLKTEKRTVAGVEIDFTFWRCEESGEQFTTTEQDEVHIEQINKVRYANNRK